MSRFNMSSFNMTSVCLVCLLPLCGSQPGERSQAENQQAALVEKGKKTDRCQELGDFEKGQKDTLTKHE